MTSNIPVKARPSPAGAARSVPLTSHVPERPLLRTESFCFGSKVRVPWGRMPTFGVGGSGMAGMWP